MDIVWYGHSCFRVSERGQAAIVTDPFGPDLGYEIPRLKADIVTLSHDAPGHNYLAAIKGYEHVIGGPGEYEIGGVFILGIATFDQTQETPRRNVVYVFDYDSLIVAHLGDLDHVPTQAQIEDLGTVDVALVPVGGGSALSPSQAAEVISLIEPSIVVPMHYKTGKLDLKLGAVTRFLSEMGIGKVDPLPMLKATKSDLGDETQVVVLEPAG